MNFKTTLVRHPWGEELVFARAANKYAGRVLVLYKGRQVASTFHGASHATIHVLKGKLTLRSRGGTIIARPGWTFTTGTKRIYDARHGRVTMIVTSAPN